MPRRRPPRTSTTRTSPHAWPTRPNWTRSWPNPRRAPSSRSNWSTRWRRACATCATRRSATARAPAPARRSRSHSRRTKVMARGGIMKRTHLLALGVATTALALASCETTPKNSALLTQARDTVAQAGNDPNVTRYAPTELDRARKLLTNAEGAAKEKGASDQSASHYAYLATQMARIAEQRAHEQVAVARIKQGETERQQILLSAREGEAERAKADAAQARNETQNAQAQAQAQIAQAQAEAQRLAAQLEDV